MFAFFRKKNTALPPLQFHNTLSGTTEPFVPLGREVKMYNCGPTVYGPQHIGNMRAAVFADLLRRTVEAWGYPVKQVINITDFGHLQGGDVGDDATEDKMTVGLRSEGLELTLPNMRTLAEKYAQAYFNDIAQLGLPVEKIQFPRASDYIPEQIALIKGLVEKGYAYEGVSGVYYDVSRFPAYGKLGGINLAGLQEGARVEANAEKRGPYDFLLWKKDSALGWESPWGRGFPGWHIECTAMIFTLLGRQIDIHTGGIEHIPVHHNNEIAQGEALSGKQYVRYWLHNDHITIEGRKISKSIGNTVYLHNIVDRGFSARALRYWYLNGHYRSQMNFTWEAVEGANTALLRLQRFFFEELAKERRAAPDQKFVHDFYAAIGDDLDTPKALARVWELVRDQSVAPAAKKASLLVADKILGLGLSEKRPANKLAIATEAELPEDVRTLVAQREAARANKDFARSDELRAKIEELGYQVKDTAEGAKVVKL